MGVLEKALKDIYYNPLNRGSLGGPLKLWKAVKAEGYVNVTMNAVKQWLMKHDTYTLMHQREGNFVETWWKCEE